MKSERAAVVVVGGGPAGSTAATLIRQRNPDRRIVLIEKDAFPRHHVGESTLPDMNAILRKLGVLSKIDGAGFVRKRGISYKFSHDKPPFSDVFSTGVLDALAGNPTDSLPDYSWQVERGRYDQILLENAKDHGVEVLQPAFVEKVLRDGARITGVQLQDEHDRELAIESDFVVDCSGQGRLIPRTLRLERQLHALGDLAIYGYFLGFHWQEELIGTPSTSKIYFSACSAGWLWFIPISPEMVSVGLVTRKQLLEDRTPESLFEAGLGECAEFRTMLKGAVPTAAPHSPETGAKLHVAADWSYSHRHPCGQGWYLAGDSAAFVDPILSSGILLAHHSGLSVANAIRTEWHFPEIPRDELHAGYAEFYADMYDGFLSMAQWWYQRRSVAGIDEWLAKAASLGASARGSRDVSPDNTSAFMTFAAGYLADFRFVNLGCGLGEQGFAETVALHGGVESKGDRMRRRILDRSRPLKAHFDRVQVGSYITTDVDSDRWWRLPVLHFEGNFADGPKRLYRPPVPPALRENGAALVLRIAERILSLCDGVRPVEAVVRAVTDRTTGAPERDVRHLCNLVLSDLVMLDVVRGESDPV